VIFVQEFDKVPGVTSQQLKSIYFQVVQQWTEIWPSNRFMGLYERKFVGSGAQFMALWEMPGFSAFDEWHSEWPGVKDSGFVDLENRLWAMTANLTSRVMERVPMPE
jgi:hypothetical protein